MKSKAATGWGVKSSDIRGQVEQARERQRKRFAGTGRDGRPPMRENADVVTQHQTNFSARAYQRVLKLARIIADRANSDRTATPHMGEAIQCRAGEQS